MTQTDKIVRAFAQGRPLCGRPCAALLARWREPVYAPSAMHKVVDFGALRSEQLAAFFAQSKANVGVLTDMMAIESLKQKEVRHYQLSLDVLSRNAREPRPRR